MTPEQPLPMGKVPDLGSFEKKLLGAVVVGALGVGSLGLYSSYHSVSAAAARWGFSPQWILPVALDGAIPVFSLGYLLLIRLGMPLAWVRWIPWALTLVTVYLNVNAAGDVLAARIGHGSLPLLWVTCSEIAAHVYRVLIGEATGRRMERVRRARWVLAPVTTARLWRRMIMWEVTSYRQGLALEQDRQLARADLRDRFGRWWRWKVSRRQLALLHFGELAPLDLGLPAGGKLATAPELAPAHLGGGVPAPRPDLATETPTGARSALTSESGVGDELAPVPAERSGDLATVFPLPVESPAVPEDDPVITPLGASSELAEEAGDNSGETPEEAGASSELAAGSGDSGSGDRKPTARSGGKRRKRRPMEEWVELAAPVFHREFRRLKRQPTGEEFADAIELAGLGAVSASTAKNIRTEILDRTDLPVLT